MGGGAVSGETATVSKIAVVEAAAKEAACEKEEASVGAASGKVVGEAAVGVALGAVIPSVQL